MELSLLEIVQLIGWGYLIIGLIAAPMVLATFVAIQLHKRFFWLS